MGERNLRAFIASGYNHISINPDYEMMRRLNKAGFMEKGSPYHGWLCTIETAVIQMAVQLNIPLIFYGEDGEVEYGGSTETSGSPFLTLEYISRVWFEGQDDYVKLLRQAKQVHTNTTFLSYPTLPTDLLIISKYQPGLISRTGIPTAIIWWQRSIAGFHK